jgi:D-glycero-beta-D-manno-heptose-7-phosphate kinase
MITENMEKLLQNISGKRVMIIGDIMLDHYTFGSVSRISPEAPVPVVEVIDEQYLLGGAGNVARNIVALGGMATMVGLIGDDHDGETLNKLLAKSFIDTALVHDNQRRTTRKTRILAQNQQIVRVDREHTAPLSKQVVGSLLETITRIGQHHDIVVVSDYGKGVINRTIMDALRSLKGKDGARPRLLVDPKPVNYDLYHDVDILTPNAKEASEGAGLSCAWPSGPAKVGEALFKRLHCHDLLITLGAQGMALFEGPAKASHIPTFARKVFDVTGAGDTVIATMALAMAAGAALLDAAVLANHAAGIVVGQVGAATPTPEALRKSLLTTQASSITPLPSLADQKSE